MVSAKPYKGFRWEAVGEFFIGTVFLCALLIAGTESANYRHLAITKLLCIAVLFSFLLYMKRGAILSWIKDIASFSEDGYRDYKSAREELPVITLRTIEFSGSQICLPGVSRASTTYTYAPDKKEKASGRQKQKSSSKKRRVGEQLSLFSA